MNCKVCVLLSTYNGEKYLDEQLHSLDKQNIDGLRIFVRDDGSSDSTIEILKKWQETGILTWYQGDNVGPARSFLELINKAQYSDYYAFCDQDDFWKSEKIQVAVESLNNYSHIPAMYYSQTQLVDDKLVPIKTEIISPVQSLKQAIVNHTATGCTIVFNHRLKEYLSFYHPRYVSMHDSWVHQVCLAVNGFVYFDSLSHILYRQHANNVLGLKKNMIKEWKRRLYKNFVINDRERSQTAHELLLGYSTFMTIENRKLLSMIENYRWNFHSKLNLLFTKVLTPINIKYGIMFRLAVLINRF